MNTLRSDKKLYIFDWDGTIMDSINHIVTSLISAGNSVGADITTDAAKNIIGLGLPEAVRILFPHHQQQWEHIQQAYVQNSIQNSADTVLYHGIENLLKQLHVESNLLAVATGKTRKGLDRVLDESQLRPYFTSSRGADETKSKPHPLMLSEILTETGIDVADAVMIGDSSYDMEMAQNIGMDRVAVTYGVHDVKTLEQYKPNAIVHDSLALAQLLLAS